MLKVQKQTNALAEMVNRSFCTKQNKYDELLKNVNNTICVCSDKGSVSICPSELNCDYSE